MSLNPCVQDGLIFKLPDEILLFIFKNLTTAELVVTAGFVNDSCFFSLIEFPLFK